VDDLLSVPGFTTDVLAKLKDFVIVLPRPMPLNANTASAQVLVSRIDGLAISDGRALVASREHAVFRDKADLETRLKDKQVSFTDQEITFGSHYFLVNGRVNLSRAALSVQALVERSVMGDRIIWILEN